MKVEPAMSESRSAATEVREAMVALTRRMRRQRPDHGLSVSQTQILGDLSRYGTSTPVELAARGGVKVQSLTASLNVLEGAALVTRRTDPADRRRQLVELTEPGSHLMDADRAQRDAWLEAAMREHLSELERGLLQLVAPVLRKLAESPDVPVAPAGHPPPS